MAALPSSDLPGHKQLRDRVRAALERCQESQDIDLKESAAWEDLQWRITHAALGMGNLRDGGIIIVGVSQRSTSWERSGISDEHLATYDADRIIDHVNSYVSPYVDIDVVIHDHEGKPFLALYVHELRDTPLVCKKNGPSGSKLQEGCVYVRPLGMARTSKITNATQMHELLELAAEKRARRLLETWERVGIGAAAKARIEKADREKFDAELGGL